MNRFEWASSVQSCDAPAAATTNDEMQRGYSDFVKPSASSTQSRTSCFGGQSSWCVPPSIIDIQEKINSLYCLVRAIFMHDVKFDVGAPFAKYRGWIHCRNPKYERRLKRVKYIQITLSRVPLFAPVSTVLQLSCQGPIDCNQQCAMISTRHEKQLNWAATPVAGFTFSGSRDEIAVVQFGSFQFSSVQVLRALCTWL